ncbi:MAG: dipeptidase, partial [Clostridia bacterium]|nr:dipeptidase [Clostridia bacterium]
TRYQNAVLTEGRKLVLEYDKKLFKTGDISLCAEANEKLAAMAKEQTSKALTAVLHESSVTMKNGYNRADN